MITVSDNESCNELVKLQTDSLDFKKVRRILTNIWKKRLYRDKCAAHPPSCSIRTGESGWQKHDFCKIAALCSEKSTRGMCQQRVSEEMLNLLSNQENTWKIPRTSDGIKSANKTGETDQDQHDIAIVYGERQLISYVMSENCRRNEYGGDEHSRIFQRLYIII